MLRWDNLYLYLVRIKFNIFLDNEDKNTFFSQRDKINLCAKFLVELIKVIKNNFFEVIVD